MYVIAMKNRPYEISAMKQLQKHGYLRPGMVPLVEIIKETHKYDDLVDPETGAPIKRKQRCNDGVVRSYRITDQSTERDVTLQGIADLFPERDVLVDYFRCDLGKYHYDAGKIELVLRLNRDLNLYCGKVLGIAAYPHLIPVVTVKQGMDDVLSPEQVVSLANDLRRDNPSQRIALRFDDIDDYENVAKQVLRDGDCLIYEFNEQPIRSKPVECRRLKNLNLPAQIVALCSPRRRELTGKDFKDCKDGEVTNLIDNAHLDVYKNYGFDGVGDYGGLRDNLPDRGANKGRALAIMYDGKVNGFKIYVKDDYDLGPNGFWDVVERMLADTELAQDDTCLALAAITDKYRRHEKGYTFAEWIKYTLVRYIQQLAMSRPGFV